jgi:hypothetical protein
LDIHEGLGYGYREKAISVIGLDGTPYPAFMYAAEETYIDQTLRRIRGTRRLFSQVPASMACRQNMSPRSKLCPKRKI